MLSGLGLLGSAGDGTAGGFVTAADGVESGGCLVGICVKSGLALILGTLIGVSGDKEIGDCGVGPCAGDNGSGVDLPTLGEVEVEVPFNAPAGDAIFGCWEPWKGNCEDCTSGVCVDNRGGLVGGIAVPGAA